MITDILTIMWKEWQEIIAENNQNRSSLLRVAIIIIIFSIVLPLQAGAGWVSANAAIGLWVILPYFLLSRTIPDSFVGERERHTLESLLASRLPDFAILFGKLITPVLFSWISTQLILLFTLIPINIVFSSEGLLFFSGKIILLGTSFSFLTAIITALAGILISLHAATLRQAQQAMSLLMFVLFIIPSLGISLLSNLFPGQDLTTWISMLQSAKPAPILLVFYAILLLLLFILLGLCMFRFRRSRLILE